MLSLSQLQTVISEKINNLNIEKEPQNLYAPVSYTLASGGKRIRPVLCLAACNLFSENIEPAVPAALAVEVFHNFTLLHDDIMDDSPIRRNKETVHKKWNNNIAILSGDTMMIKAYELLAELPQNLLKPVLKLFNETALGVCEGQQYDMDFENRQQVSESEYLKMIKLKTSVLIAASLKAGAICGGATEKDAGLLYDFGLNLGAAFQIQDDLLDVYADTSAFGKQRGKDILTGKKTFLLTKALEIADKETKNKLQYLINNSNIPETEKINAVTKIYEMLNIKKEAENKISEYHDIAIKSMNKVSVTPDKKQELLNFASQIMKRKK
ncbi:MAG: polyprenyl synthetase family protein [Chlorobi bacterium]|nr:polyprenyl synthetase family protein [Chlorobiota bacterium]